MTISCFDIIQRIREVEKEPVTFDNAVEHYKTLVELYALKSFLEE